MWVPNARPAQAFDNGEWTVIRTARGWRAIRHGSTERLEAATLPELARKLRAYEVEKISNSA